MTITIEDGKTAVEVEDMHPMTPEDLAWMKDAYVNPTRPGDDEVIDHIIAAAGSFC